MFIDPQRPDYAHLNEVSLKTLMRGYLPQGTTKENAKEAAITRLDQMISRAEARLGFRLEWLRLGAKRAWFSPSSPNWSNYGAPSAKALPISCNGSYMDDSIESIISTASEVAMMTALGSGTSVYMHPVRPSGSPISSGGKADGPTHYAGLIQEAITVISQNGVRRGSSNISIDVDHPDFYEWMKMRSEFNGVHHHIQHVDFSVNLSDEFMASMDTDPKGSPNRMKMAAIVAKRKETGRPFILFKGNANKYKPQVLKDFGLNIEATNLCTEIMLHSSPTESFVCNLSSANLLYWHEWKDTPFIREMVYYLDAVLDEYIEKTANLYAMERAHRSAKRWRALGLGVLGWHSLLQSMLLPIETEEAAALNIEIFKRIKEESYAASAFLAEKFGEPEGMKGYGRRNLTLNAVAPTQSSSVICGQVSKGIEPWEAVVFENDTAKVVYTEYNPFFVKLARDRGHDTPEMWTSVMLNGGRVDHLDWLSDREKETFKPWIDIDPMVLVQQNNDRSAYVDQGVSFNIVLPEDATKKDDVDLLKALWRGGSKSAYYRKGENTSQKLARQNACEACEA